MKACTANLCRQGRAPCPCPQSCQLPEACPAWSAAAYHPSQRNSLRTELRAMAIHCAAVGLAVAALVFIVKTASNA